MHIVINIENPTPLFTQLIEQIKQAVIDGKVAPKDPLPSIRQLANDLEINSKTVAKAYRLLERDSIIQTKGYRGTFVHPHAVENSSVDLNEWVTRTLQKNIEKFKQVGVTDSEIRIAFNNILNNRND